MCAGALPARAPDGSAVPSRGGLRYGPAVPLYALGEQVPDIHPEAYVHPDAVVIGSVTLHANASIWFNCVVRGDTDELIIGENSNIQDGSVLHTDPGIKLRVPLQSET